LALFKSGKSNSEWIRHIAIRFFFVADRVASKEIALEYMPTEHMLTDILTKPLQGSKFLNARKLLLNWQDQWYFHHLLICFVAKLGAVWENIFAVAYTSYTSQLQRRICYILFCLK
jgi:hypothetical protein